MMMMHDDDDDDDDDDASATAHTTYIQTVSIPFQYISATILLSYITILTILLIIH